MKFFVSSENLLFLLVLLFHFLPAPINGSVMLLFISFKEMLMFCITFQYISMIVLICSLFSVQLMYLLKFLSYFQYTCTFIIRFHLYELFYVYGIFHV